MLQMTLPASLNATNDTIVRCKLTKLKLLMLITYNVGKYLCIHCIVNNFGGETLLQILQITIIH